MLVLGYLNEMSKELSRPRARDDITNVKHNDVTFWQIQNDALSVSKICVVTFD